MVKVALGVLLLGAALACAAAPPHANRSDESAAVSASGNKCYIGGAWIRKEYYDDIMRGKTPAQAFRGSTPVSAIVVSTSCDSVVVVNNFHDRDFCRIERNGESQWNLLNYQTNRLMYSLRFSSSSGHLSLVSGDAEYTFTRYPGDYSVHRMPTEFINQHTIAGRYRELYPGDAEVAFTADGRIEGVKPYSGYLVGFDFVLNECDYLLLGVPGKPGSHAFVWSIKGDTLALRPFEGLRCAEAKERVPAFTFVRIAK